MFRMPSSVCRLAGFAISSILSCDSDVMISAGVMSGSRSVILPNSTSTPVPPFHATSERADERPPPPRSFIPLIVWPSTASVIASRMSFLVNGAGTWTDERSESASPERFFDAKVAPPIPSRPVLPPVKTSMSPGNLASARTRSFLLPTPTHATSTRQFLSKDSSNSTSPATVGTPTQLP